MDHSSDEVRGIKYSSPIVGVMDWKYRDKDPSKGKYEPRSALDYCIKRLSQKTAKILSDPFCEESAKENAREVNIFCANDVKNFPKDQFVDMRNEQLNALLIWINVILIEKVIKPFYAVGNVAFDKAVSKVLKNEIEVYKRESEKKYEKMVLAMRQLNILVGILEMTHLNEFNKVQEFQKYLDKLLLSKLKDLPKKEETRMIMLYTMNSPFPPFSRLLNRELRKEDREELKPYFPLLRLLLKALYKLPRFEGTVWRFLRLKKDESNFLKHDYRQGNKLFWWGFTSCTTDVAPIKNTVNYDPNYVEILFCIQSLRGIEIDLYSMEPSQEDILLLPGTYLEVINSLKYNDNLYLITLKELNPENQQLMFPEMTELDTYKTKEQKIDEELVELRTKLQEKERLNTINEDSNDLVRENERLKAENRNLKLQEIELIELRTKLQEIERLNTINEDSNDLVRENERLKAEIRNIRSINEMNILEKINRGRRHSSSDRISQSVKQGTQKKKGNKRILSVQEDNAKSEQSELSEEKTESLSHRKKTTNKNKNNRHKNEDKTYIKLESELIICKTKLNVIDALKSKQNIQLDMERLNLWHRNIGDIGVSKISKAIRNQKNNLTSLELPFNNITKEGASELSKALESKNCLLIDLNLTGNPIQTEGIRCIFQSLLINACLKTIIISRINFDIAAVETIAEFISNNHLMLTKLMINGNNIGNEGAQRISKALEVNTTLLELNLSYNKIGNEGGLCIKEAVLVNKTLNYLWLQGNKKISREITTGIIDNWQIIESRRNSCII